MHFIFIVLLLLCYGSICVSFKKRIRLLKSNPKNETTASLFSFRDIHYPSSKHFLSFSTLKASSGDIPSVGRHQYVSLTSWNYGKNRRWKLRVSILGRCHELFMPVFLKLDCVTHNYRRAASPKIWERNWIYCGLSANFLSVAYLVHQ